MVGERREGVMRVTKAELKRGLEDNLKIANTILANMSSIADKPQVLIKYMEYRHKAMTMLYDLNSEADTSATLEAENERLRRKVKDLEYNLNILRDKHGIVPDQNTVDAGSLHDSGPVGTRRDPTQTHADPVGLHTQLTGP